ncbi:type I methionyl aminopeptidase [Nonomuraea sp. KC401]|uniref:type I methionyl aminopeptidase n=1 Tax=unclassified Nonomuraea TaxID=2593643 RepID=UPI0010FE9357|nr:type I methionyl aminopeptidase [Nonomuraea sp. KC401]NBE96071.1 type I methionyl aminopeptidase [Nonomuraea sp. K271]TLF80270.1 type I methionyl aminopeptidase [Nonomuraea sp. KC401]
MIELKSAGEIAAMREAGKVVAAVHAAVRERAGIGVTLKQLDEVARTVIEEARAGASFLGYHPSFGAMPYPGVICTSVNGVMLHGLPTPYRLRDGDLISIDCGAYVDGWHADGTVSFTVGHPRDEDLKMIKVAEETLAAGIEAALPGGRMGDIGHAMSAVGRGAGYGMQNDFGGHGIGRAMHESPFVPNEARGGRGLRLRTGLVIAIEPSLMAGGGDAYYMADDGWSVCSGDDSRSVHVEHTVAITDDGPVVLTVP